MLSMHIGKVDIRPGVSVLGLLRHLNYKAWFAVAEFVDNAIQSFLENRERLETLHGAGFRLRVNVEVDSSQPGRIAISDNAAGIASSSYARAFRPAAPPPDSSGLSEFGMGMKSAACWFSPRWTVRTKALGETIERTIQFDISGIVHDDISEIAIEENESDSKVHYTEVILEYLHRPPVGRTISKLKYHLADIYRIFIREGLIQLRIDGELLGYERSRR